MVLHVAEVYDDSLPFRCGNLDCRAVLTAPFYHLRAAVPPSKGLGGWRSDLMVCQTCNDLTIAASTKRQLEFRIQLPDAVVS